MIEVCGYLHRKLAAGNEHCCQARKQCPVVAHPLQRRVGEDDIDGFPRLPHGDVAARERQPVDLEGVSAFEHRRR